MKFRRRKIKPLTLADVTIVRPDAYRRVITAAALGNAMEWFDFGVYGFLAATLGRVFFPEIAASVRMVAAFATFSIPFLIRPLGGYVCGRLGDRYGRQRVLTVTIVMMALSTAAIGLIPGYGAIGAAAPLLLILCKLAQGFSVGGEYVGASIFVAEYAPDRKRGFLGSWIEFGTLAGLVFGAGLVTLLNMTLDQGALDSWGWRLPFFLALPLGALGLYLRNALDETPAFREHLSRMEEGDKEALEKGPQIGLKEIFSRHWRHLLVCIGLVITMDITYYLLTAYLASYLTQSLHYPESRGVLIIVAVMVAMMFIQPVVGLFSDRFGRRPFVLTGSLALLLLSIPCFLMIDSGHVPMIFIGLLILAIIANCFTGIMASTIPALFPTAVRFSALSAGFNVAIIVAGQLPTLLSWATSASGNLLMPAYFLMGNALIGLLTWLKMPETAGRALQGATPTATNLSEAKEILDEHYESVEAQIEKTAREIRETTEALEDLKKKKQNLLAQLPVTAGLPE